MKVRLEGSSDAKYYHGKGERPMFSLGSSSEGSLELSVESFNGAVGLWGVAGSTVAEAAKERHQLPPHS